MIEKRIFRAYDIRGAFEDTLTLETAYLIGYYLGRKIISTSPRKKTCVVGYDGRLSSPDIFHVFTSGLLLAEVNVVNISLVPTPVVYYADKILNPSASVMITGSHNPKNDNGFKIIFNNNPFFGENIQKLGLQVLENKENIKLKNLNRIEITSFRDILSSYINHIISDISISPNLKVIWDSGNGATGDLVKTLIKKLPNSNLAINAIIDGKFPNHHPDPTDPNNLVQLMNAVKIHNYDLGVAFDGDGDRIGVVTKKGHIIWGDQLLCLFSKDILKKHPNATIITDVKVSQTLFDYITNLKGNIIMWRTGHSLIKTKMVETNALLAGEMSGHIFFSDRYYGYDDAIYAALRLLELISSSNKTLDELVEELPLTYNTPEIKIFVSNDDKFNIINTLKEDLISKNIKFNDIDGVRVNTENGWWLLRASNTQEALIFRGESSSQSQLSILIENVNKVFSTHNIPLLKYKYLN